MKKLFSTSLMAAMLFIGVNANAATLKVGVGETYTTLTAAVSAAKSGDVIEFTSDITTTTGALVSNKVLTIDLKGFTYTYAPTGSESSTNTRNIKVTGSTSKVTVKNGTLIAQGGKGPDYGKTTGYNTGSGAIGTFRSAGGAGLILENLTLYNYHPWGLSIKMENSATAADLQVNNCKIYSETGGGIEACGANVTINGTEFEQKGENKSYGYLASCINVSVLGTITINNSSFKSSGEHSLYVFNSGGHIIVNNGLFSGEKNVIQVDAANKKSLADELYDNTDDSHQAQAQLLIDAFAETEGWNQASEIKINDGIFTGTIKVGTLKDAEPGKLTVSGGTFNVQGDEKSATELDKAIVEGAEKVTNPDGTISVIKEDKKVQATTEIPSDAKDKMVVVPVATNIVVADGEKKEVKQLNVSANSTVTVEDGGVLRMNGQTGAIVASTGKIIVEAGGKLLADSGMVYSKNAKSIVIESDKNKSGEFLISPDVQMYGDQHPAATVKMTAHMGKKQDGSYVWYRFGVPMYEMSTMYTAAKIETYIYEWDVQANDWKQVANVRDLKPFQGYIMTTTAELGDYEYEFTGTLYGNATDTAKFEGAKGQWASFANSYTGRADVATILADALEGGKLSSIKLWDVANQRFDETVTLKSIKDGDVDEALQKVAPLRPIVFQVEDAGASMIIDYKKAIWNFAIPAPAAIAARKGAATDNSKIFLTATANATKLAQVNMYQESDYSDAFEAAVDSRLQGENTVSLYVVCGNDTLASCGTNDLNNKIVGIVSTTDTTVAINCTKFEGTVNFALKNALGVEYAISKKDSIMVLSLVANEPVEFTLINKDANQYTRTVATDNWATMCYPDSITAVDGADIYQIVAINTAKTKVAVDEVNVLNMKPGKAYLFNATADAQTFTYFPSSAVADSIQNNGLIGTFNGITLAEEKWVLTNNTITPAAAGSIVGQYRCYIDLSKTTVDDKVFTTAAPGRKIFTIVGTTTELENVNLNVNANGKMMINGQLVIIRDGKMFNAQGQEL